MQRPDYRPEYSYETPEIQVAYDWLQEIMRKRELPISFAPLDEIYRSDFDRALNHMMASTFSPPTSVLLKMIEANQDLIDRLSEQLDGHVGHLQADAPDLAGLLADLRPGLAGSARDTITYEMYAEVVCLRPGEGYGPLARAFEDRMAMSAEPAAAMIPLKRMLCDMRREYRGIKTFVEDEYLDPGPHLTPGTNPPPMVDGIGLVSVAGRVKDKHSNQPIENAVVVFSDKVKTKTDDSGRFELRAIPTGLYTVTVTDFSGKVRHGTSEPRTLTLKLPPEPRWFKSLAPDSVSIVQDLGVFLIDRTADPLGSFIDGASGLASAIDPAKRLKETLVNDCLKNRGVNIEGLEWHMPDPPINFQIGNILWGKIVADWNMLFSEVGGLFAAASKEFLLALENDLLDFLGKSICDARTLAWVLTMFSQDKALRWDSFNDVIGSNFTNKLNQGEVAKKIKDWQKVGDNLKKEVDAARETLSAGASVVGEYRTQKAWSKLWQAMQDFLTQMGKEILGLGGVFLQQLAVNFMANAMCLNMSSLMACMRQAQETVAYLPSNQDKGRFPNNWDSLTMDDKIAHLNREFPLKNYMIVENQRPINHGVGIVDEGDYMPVSPSTYDVSRDLNEAYAAAEKHQGEDIGKEMKLFRERMQTDRLVKSVYDVMLQTTSKQPNQPVNVAFSSLPTVSKMMQTASQQIMAINQSLEGFADRLFLGTSLSGETRAKLISTVKELLFIRQVIGALTDPELVGKLGKTASDSIEQARQAGANALTPPKE